MDTTNSKKQSAKVIISEVIMFIAVVITVIILALLVSGYWLNSNFQVERNGMLQISSIPTGADVEIDGVGSSWLERTNSSKILGSGEHTVLLTKDGYDTWSKTISISEGLLYRLHYPRLFLTERTSTNVFDSTKYTSATVAPNHNSLLLINDTSDWSYINLESDEPKPVKMDVSEIITGEILQADWDVDASHILFRINNNGTIEWVLFDISDIKKSINLTKEFGADFKNIEIIDNNSNILLATRNGNLHKIDVPGRLISAVLAEKVVDFDHYHHEIVYSTESGDIGYFRLGDAKPSILTTTKTPGKVTISRFYDSKYITILEGQDISVHSKDDFKEKVTDYKLTFTPDAVEVGHDGEFILFIKERRIASLDMEAKLVREWTIEGNYGWLDNDMFYAVSEDGSLIVYDYDGFNRRVLASGVSPELPVTITNDRWLYYFKNHHLVREVIVK